jgi:NADH:ubiquinone reductase (H+-translocating)
VESRPPQSQRPRVVIIGAGFAGLEAAKRLRKEPVEVVVVDRTNHHLFQPLLYQVAVGVLSPADIASPTRFLLRRQGNARVLLSLVESVDPQRRVVKLGEEQGELAYDFLIVASGARHSYFNHPEWEPLAPGLKSLDDAREIRRRVLAALELAERATDPAEREALMTIVIVGAGPTGVELAGILPAIIRKGMRKEFRNIDVERMRILLLEGGPRALPAFTEDLSARACRDLHELGVEVRTGAIVTRLEDDAVYVGDERIPARTVIWAAGNEASPLTRSLDSPLDRAGRVRVAPDLSLTDYPEVFVVGDAAAVPLEPPSDQDPEARSWGHAGNSDTPRHGAESETRRPPPAYVPAVAPAATQMGRHAAEMIKRSIRGEPRRAFAYRDKGNLATIGRHRAIANISGVKLTGQIAWLAWLFVHILYLVGFRNRLVVLLEWAYAYFTNRPGARLLTEEQVRQPGRLVPAPHGLMEDTRAPAGNAPTEDTLADDTPTPTRTVP